MGGGGGGVCGVMRECVLRIGEGEESGRRRGKNSVRVGKR